MLKLKLGSGLKMGCFDAREAHHRSSTLECRDDATLSGLFTKNQK